MPRKSRFYLPDVPVHLVQRGHNRRPCFGDEADYRFYLDALQEGLKRYNASLHAYCLMTNHVHWLVTPAREDSLSRIVQHVGRHYVMYFNRRYQRRGTLWDGRHKGSLIDSERYLLACYRYIEMNPVKAGMVAKPETYPWSSYCHNALGQTSLYVTQHALYRQLGRTADERRAHYRVLFAQVADEDQQQVLRRGATSNWPTGGNDFCRKIESMLGIRLGNGKPGRPRIV